MGKGLVRGAAVALPIAAALGVLAAPAALAAAATTLPAVSIGVGAASTPGQVTSSVQILLALTVLSLAPAVLLLMTSFTRIVVVLSFARTALGSGNLPPNQVLVGLALFLTLFVMAPTLQQIYSQAYQPYQAGTLSLGAAARAAEDPLRAFMLRQTRAADLAMFAQMQRAQQASTSSSPTAGQGLPVPSAAPVAPTAPAAGASGSSAATASVAPGPSAGGSAATPLVVLVPAFVISELRTSFEMGFLLFVPFVIIDLVVASTLMAMGMVMLPPMLISLPFKILLFVLVDGWSLLAQSLVTSFR